jgi:hypothetical protein
LFKGEAKIVSWIIKRNGGRTYTEQEGEKDEEEFEHGAGLGAVPEEFERDDGIVTKGNWLDCL